MCFSFFCSRRGRRRTTGARPGPTILRGFTAGHGAGAYSLCPCHHFRFAGFDWLMFARIRVLIRLFFSDLIIVDWRSAFSECVFFFAVGGGAHSLVNYKPMSEMRALNFRSRTTGSGCLTFVMVGGGGGIVGNSFSSFPQWLIYSGRKSAQRRSRSTCRDLSSWLGIHR